MLYCVCILFYKISIEIKYMLASLFTFVHRVKKLCLCKTTFGMTTYYIFIHTIKRKCKFCPSILHKKKK